MKNKLVLFLLLGASIGVQASAASLDEYHSDGYFVDQAGDFSLLDSPSKYKTARMSRRDSASKTSRKYTRNDEGGIARRGKSNKGETLRHQVARDEKQKEKN